MLFFVFGANMGASATLTFLVVVVIVFLGLPSIDFLPYIMISWVLVVISF
jgi:hypothetical protein